MSKKTSAADHRVAIAADSHTCKECGQMVPGPLAKRLAALRDELDLTRGEVTMRGGPSMGTQSKLETGGAPMGYAALYNYATAYGVDPLQLNAYLTGGIKLQQFLKLVGSRG